MVTLTSLRHIGGATTDVNRASSVINTGAFDHNVGNNRIQFCIVGCIHRITVAVGRRRINGNITVGWARKSTVVV